MKLREAAEQALEYIEQNAIIGGIPIRDALRAALAEDAMQRLTNVQQEMEATIKDNLTVEPVAYVTGYSKGRCIIEAVDPAWLLPVGMALYRSPTINEMETVEPVAWRTKNATPPGGYVVFQQYPSAVANLGGEIEPLYTDPPKRTPLTENQIRRIDDGTPFHEGPDWAIRFTREIERAHGIGGEE